MSVLVFALLFASGVFVYRRRKRLSTAEISLNCAVLSDNWEINRGNLLLLEQIGQGFYGLVFKAKLYHTLSQPTNKKGRIKDNKTNDKMISIAACKVLKGNKC